MQISDSEEFSSKIYMGRNELQAMRINMDEKYNLIGMLQRKLLRLA